MMFKVYIGWGLDMFAYIQLIVNDCSLHLIDGHTHIYKTVFDIVKSLSLWLWKPPDISKRR